MLDYINEFSGDNYQLCKGVIYHGFRFEKINNYSYFIPYIPRRKRSQCVIYRLDFETISKKVTNISNLRLTPIDFDNLLFRVAKGNVNFIIVDEFNGDTRKLYNAIKYADAPHNRVEIIRPITFRYVNNHFYNHPDMFLITKKVPQIFTDEIKSYNYFQMDNLCKVKNKKRLKCPSDLIIESDLREFILKLFSDKIPQRIDISILADEIYLMFYD